MHLQPNRSALPRTERSVRGHEDKSATIPARVRGEQARVSLHAPAALRRQRVQQATVDQGLQLPTHHVPRPQVDQLILRICIIPPSRHPCTAAMPLLLRLCAIVPLIVTITVML